MLLHQCPVSQISASSQNMHRTLAWNTREYYTVIARGLLFESDNFNGTPETRDATNRLRFVHFQIGDEGTLASPEDFYTKRTILLNT